VNQLKTHSESDAAATHIEIRLNARKFAAIRDIKVKEDIDRSGVEYSKLKEPWFVARGRAAIAGSPAKLTCEWNHVNLDCVMFIKGKTFLSL
jgi:hypothetical protein